MIDSACQLPTACLQTDLELDNPSPAVYKAPSPMLPRPIEARNEVYDTFWRFAHERQKVLFRRLARARPPWSADPIIQRFRFTNAYRAADRVSQHLIRNVIYRGDQSVEEIFFRTILFKVFNRIETWALLEKELGEISWRDYRRDRIDKILSETIKGGHRIFSAAYIMSPAQYFGHAYKHQNYLSLLECMMQNNVPQRINDAKSMAEAYGVLLSFPALGPFLAFQLITDLNYSPVLDFSEMDFVVPGPGARDGISKLFIDIGEWSEVDVIRFLADNQEKEFEIRDLPFQSLWGRRLQLIDIQNLLCEIAKYCRVKYPEIPGRSGRSRIKQKFSPRSDPLAYWFPPAWGINPAVYESSLARDLDTVVPGMIF